MGVDRIREGWEHSRETEGKAKVTLESSGYSVSEGVWKHDKDWERRRGDQRGGDLGEHGTGTGGVTYKVDGPKAPRETKVQVKRLAEKEMGKKWGLGGVLKVLAAQKRYG